MVNLEIPCRAAVRAVETITPTHFIENFWPFGVDNRPLLFDVRARPAGLKVCPNPITLKGRKLPQEVSHCFILAGVLPE